MPSQTTLTDLRALLTSQHQRQPTVARTLGLLAIGAVALLAAAACSSSSSAPPVSVTPSGVGSGAHVGGWITGSYTVAEAHRDVDQYFGSTTQLPRNVPPGLALKAIWMLVPLGGNVRQEVYDYYPKDFVPPTALGQAIPANEPHVQVQAANSAGTIGNQTTPLDLGLPGYTAEVGVLSPSQRAANPAGTAEDYFLTGHGLQWTIAVWPSSPPSQADLMAFLKGIPAQ